jgi:drug/metabolite transporter (DMT)-like permease
MSKRAQAVLAMVLITALWGVTFVVVKDALGYASVFVFMAIRFGLAAAVMAAMYRTAIAGMSGEELRAGIEIGLFLFAGYALQNSGLLHTTASISAFITGSAVVLVPVLMYVIWRKHVHPGAWLGALAALVGLFWITVPADAGLRGLAQLNRGDTLTMAGAVMFALHIIFVGRYVGKHSVGALSFVQVAVTAALSAVAIPVSHMSAWETIRFDWGWQLGAALLITGVFGTAVAFSVQVWSQQYLGPSSTGILLTLEPVFAAIASFVWVGERLSGRALLGCGLILAGILIAELKGPAQAAVDAPGPVITPES